jgi:hypothetical protein
MKTIKYFVYIFIGILTFFIGVASLRDLSKGKDALEAPTLEIRTKISAESNQPRFQHLSGENSDGISAFKSSGSEFPDIFIEHDAELNIRQKRDAVELYCSKRQNDFFVERTVKLNDKGNKIGIRCLSVFTNKAFIFWSEGEDQWSITASTLELAKEFESSETFRLWKSKKK